MDPLGSLILTVVIAAASLAIMYYIVKGAVLEGMKEYLKWEVLNRPLLEAKYAKQREAAERPADQP